MQTRRLEARGGAVKQARRGAFSLLAWRKGLLRVAPSSLPPLLPQGHYASCRRPRHRCCRCRAPLSSYHTAVTRAGATPVLTRPPAAAPYLSPPGVAFPEHTEAPPPFGARP